jgi:hypothetical protein
VECSLVAFLGLIGNGKLAFFFWLRQKNQLGKGQHNFLRMANNFLSRDQWAKIYIF